MQINIREGVKEDLPAVLNLVKELAIYEKEPDEVEVTLKELEEDGFGKNPIYKFFVAEENETILGMALYYVKYSTWKGKAIYLDDIVVTEKWRGKGIGQKLFQAVVGVSRQMGVRKMEWQVLDWNTPAIEFYKKFETRFEPQWTNCKLKKEQIQHFGN
jgi:GNAT superfamily N-acetyltransferase